MICLVLDQKEDQATKPWEKILENNKDLWQVKVGAEKFYWFIMELLVVRLSQEKRE